MTLDDYELTQISEKEKQESPKYFLDLVHSGNRYDAMKFYYGVDEEVRKYMQKDSSCNWEVLNSLTKLEW